MEYTPEGSRRAGTVVGIVLFSLSAVFACFSMAGIGSSDVIALMSALSTVSAMFVLLRYRFTVFTYSVKVRGGVDLSLYGRSIYTLPAEMLDFEVTKQCGRRIVTECRLGLDTLCDVLPYNDSKKKIKSGSVRRTFHYTAKMLSCDRLALVFDDDSEKFAVIIDPSEEMKTFLEKKLKGQRRNDYTDEKV